MNITHEDIIAFKKKHPKGAIRNVYYNGRVIEGKIVDYRVNHDWLEYAVLDDIYGFKHYCKG